MTYGTLRLNIDHVCAIVDKFCTGIFFFFWLFSIYQPSTTYTLKNAGLFQPKFGTNMDKPKCWVKNVI